MLPQRVYEQIPSTTPFTQGEVWCIWQCIYLIVYWGTCRYSFLKWSWDPSEHIAWRVPCFLQLENVLGAAYRSAHLKHRLQDCSYFVVFLVLNLFVCLVITIGDALAKAHSLDSTFEFANETLYSVNLWLRCWYIIREACQGEQCSWNCSCDVTIQDSTLHLQWVGSSIISCQVVPASVGLYNCD